MTSKTEPNTPPTPLHLHTSTAWITQFVYERWYYWQAAATRRGIPFDTFKSIALFIDEQWRARGVDHGSYDLFEQHLINATALHYRNANKAVCRSVEAVPRHDTTIARPQAEEAAAPMKGAELEELLSRHGFNFRKK